MPQPGDVILRGSPADGFLLVDAQTGVLIAGPVFTFEAVFEAAERHGAHALWRESLDERGRPLGDLFKLPHLVRRRALAHP